MITHTLSSWNSEIKTRALRSRSLCVGQFATKMCVSGLQSSLVEIFKRVNNLTKTAQGSEILRVNAYAGVSPSFIPGEDFLSLQSLKQSVECGVCWQSWNFLTYSDRTSQWLPSSTKFIIFLSSLISKSLFCREEERRGFLSFLFFLSTKTPLKLENHRNRQNAGRPIMTKKPSCRSRCLHFGARVVQTQAHS